MSGRSRIRGLLIVAALALITACGDDGVSVDSEFADLAGRWDATSAVFTSHADMEQADAIALGATWSISVGLDGRYAFVTTTPPDDVTDIDQGQLQRDGDQLTIIPDEASDIPTAALLEQSGEDEITISAQDADWDFDGDGTGEPASIVAVFVRQ